MISVIEAFSEYSFLIQYTLLYLDLLIMPHAKQTSHLCNPHSCNSKRLDCMKIPHPQNLLSPFCTKELRHLSFPTEGRRLLNSSTLNRSIHKCFKATSQFMKIDPNYLRMKLDCLLEAFYHLSNPHYHQSSSKSTCTNHNNFCIFLLPNINNLSTNLPTNYCGMILMPFPAKVLHWKFQDLTKLSIKQRIFPNFLSILAVFHDFFFSSNSDFPFSDVLKILLHFT